jgi:teichuronic acid biosynthesis glycosyltransferase TuaC
MTHDFAVPDHIASAAPAAERLRILVVTRIFPNRVEPLACPFQRQQLAALSAHASVEVLGVIPYLPGASLLGDRHRVGKLRRVPREDVVDHIRVVHPRAPYIPLAGFFLTPLNVPLYLAGLFPHVAGLGGRFDVVLGAFLYPDACAAALLAAMLGLPYAVKTHGSDVNLISKMGSLRPILRATLRAAGATIGVSRPMVDRLIELGAPPERAMLLPNGVDTAIFHPGDRLQARRELGLPATGKIALFVGRLEAAKGVRELVSAFSRLHSARGGQALHLVFAGSGTLDRELAPQASGESGITLAGLCTLPQVASYLRAADVLVLPSWEEGTPNVILEALATGRPVVATRVGGIPDVVREGHTGLLVPPRDVAALTRALEQALDRAWDEHEITRWAPPSWDQNARTLLGALELTVRESRAPARRLLYRALCRIAGAAAAPTHPSAPPAQAPP